MSLTEPHEGSFAQLSWSVDFEAGLPNGKRSSYAFDFEPFEGKLTVISHGLVGVLSPDE